MDDYSPVCEASDRGFNTAIDDFEKNNKLHNLGSDSNSDDSDDNMNSVDNTDSNSV